jgi:catalase
MKAQKKLTTAAGAPVVDNQNTMTAGPRGPVLLRDTWFLEKLAHFDVKSSPRGACTSRAPAPSAPLPLRMITRYTKAKLFSELGKQTEMLAR